MRFSLSAIVLVAVSATAVLGQGGPDSQGASADGSPVAAVKAATVDKIQTAGIQEKIQGAPVKLQQGVAGVFNGGKNTGAATSTKQKRSKHHHGDRHGDSDGGKHGDDDDDDDEDGGEEHRKGEP